MVTLRKDYSHQGSWHIEPAPRDDAVGAKVFGYPKYWTNRLGLPAEELGLRADPIFDDLADLPSIIINPS